MARADLHYALVLDWEIYEASQIDPDLLDPVVRLEGSLPGPAKPVAVLRRYQGPQGTYREQFAIEDPRGREIYRSPVRRIELTGEFAEDLFRDTVSNLLLSESGEHTARFFIEGQEAGWVPMFIEAGHGGSLRTALEATFGAALKKGDIMWVTVPGQGDRRTGVPTFRGVIRGRTASPQRERSQAIWFVWENGTVYVLNGAGEQNVPGLATAQEVELTVRSKDIRSAVARVPADVRRVVTGDEEWEQVANTMLSARLNIADEDEALARWREHGQILALTPRFGDIEEAAGAEQAEPAASAAGNDEAQPAAAAASASAAEPKVADVQIDQETYDKLIAEGKPERVATAKAKSAYVRKEKARLRAEQETASA